MIEDGRLRVKYGSHVDLEGSRGVLLLVMGRPLLLVRVRLHPSAGRWLLGVGMSRREACVWWSVHGGQGDEDVVESIESAMEGMFLDTGSVSYVDQPDDYYPPEYCSIRWKAQGKKQLTAKVQRLC